MLNDTEKIFWPVLQRRVLSLNQIAERDAKNLQRLRVGRFVRVRARDSDCDPCEMHVYRKH